MSSCNVLKFISVLQLEFKKPDLANEKDFSMLREVSLKLGLPITMSINWSSETCFEFYSSNLVF